MSSQKSYPLHEAIRAQQSLRDAAGLPPEQFPIEEFVGMVSDEVDALRKQGKSDQAIAEIVTQSSAIEITADEIAEHYVSPEKRHPHG